MRNKTKGQLTVREKNLKKLVSEFQNLKLRYKATRDALKKAENELGIQTWGLNKTNEGIRILYKELEMANKELQKLDQMKSDFVSHVSHELCTPLTSMQDINSQLLEGIKGHLNESQQRFIEISQKNVNRLSRLIENLLDISRIEAGRIELDRKPIDITILAREAIETLISQANNKQIKIEDRLPPSLPDIYIDPDRIRQVFVNLISNAIKYTNKGGKVTVGTKKKKDILEVSVADNGIGIPQKYFDKIFQRFERVSKVPVPGEGSAGLGLAICKELLEMHKGKIWVKSKVGMGSKFTFYLPTIKELDFFMDYLEDSIKEAEKNRSFIYLIMVKIQDLNEYKKRWGVKITEIFEDQLKNLLINYIRHPKDNIFKYREGTLAMVLLGAKKGGIKNIEKRLKNEVSKCEFKIKNEVINPFLEFRGVTYPVNGDSAKKLIKAVGG